MITELRINSMLETLSLQRNNYADALVLSLADVKELRAELQNEKAKWDDPKALESRLAELKPPELARRLESVKDAEESA